MKRSFLIAAVAVLSSAATLAVVENHATTCPPCEMPEDSFQEAGDAIVANGWINPAAMAAFDAVNAERVSQGMQPLEWSPEMYADTVQAAGQCEAGRECYVVETDDAEEAAASCGELFDPSRTRGAVASIRGRFAFASE